MQILNFVTPKSVVLDKIMITMAYHGGGGGSQKLIDNKFRILLPSYYRFINDSCGDGSDLQDIIKSSLD